MGMTDMVVRHHRHLEFSFLRHSLHFFIARSGILALLQTTVFTSFASSARVDIWRMSFPLILYLYGWIVLFDLLWFFSLSLCEEASTSQDGWFICDFVFSRRSWTCRVDEDEDDVHGNGC
jgi:hypothetical protein